MLPAKCRNGLLYHPDHLCSLASASSCPAAIIHAICAEAENDHVDAPTGTPVAELAEAVPSATPAGDVVAAAVPA